MATPTGPEHGCSGSTPTLLEKFGDSQVLETFEHGQAEFISTWGAFIPVLEGEEEAVRRKTGPASDFYLKRSEKTRRRDYVTDMKRWNDFCRKENTSLVVTAAKAEAYLREQYNHETDPKNSMLNRALASLQALRDAQKFLLPLEALKLVDNEYIKAYKVRRVRETADRQKRDATDIGLEVKGMTFTPSQLLDLANAFLRADKDLGDKLMHRSMFLMGNASMCRGDSLRRLRLNHVFVEFCQQLGPDKCYALGLVDRGGKTNANGRRDLTFAVRHNNAALCPIGGFLLHLAHLCKYEWHGLETLFPIENEEDEIQRDWYETHVFHGHQCKCKDPDTGRPVKCGCRGQKCAISYTTANDRITKAMEAIGIFVPKKTHATRVAAALDCHSRGVSADEIKHHGGWQKSHLQLSYDTRMSPAAALALGDHTVQPAPVYVMKRGRVNNTNFEELADCVFPGANELYERIIEVNKEAGKDFDLADYSLQNFLELLTMGSFWLMQDVAILLETNSPEWTSALEFLDFLKHPDWPRYREMVLEAHHSTQVFPPLPPDADPVVEIHQLKAEVHHWRTLQQQTNESLQEERKSLKEAWKSLEEERKERMQAMELVEKLTLQLTGGAETDKKRRRVTSVQASAGLADEPQDAMDIDVPSPHVDQGDNQAPHDEALASSNSTLPPQESQPADPAAPHRLRFSDAKFRTSDAIHDVWEKYKEPVDGVSFRSLDENNAGWSNRAKWTDRPAYQAYLKWSLITERIKVYALAIAAALGIGAQEAEQKAVQVLQYERYIANVSLSTFRQQALKKEATGGLRTRNPQELGLELQATLQKLENLEKSAHKKVAAL